MPQEEAMLAPNISSRHFLTVGTIRCSAACVRGFCGERSGVLVGAEPLINLIVGRSLRSLGDVSWCHCEDVLIMLLCILIA
jgi:hypothetical protein